MTPLAERLAKRIASTGPITVAEFMAAALADPALGYYRQADPLGRQGDFVTAPEISQLFGELIGAWLIDCWDKVGRPSPVRLVELGPGRGTLMQDALRVGKLAPAWLGAIELHLVEINPALRKLQAERLAPHAPTWHESLESVPDGPLLLVANEFFDALPIRQLLFAGGQWRERRINWTSEEGFNFVPSPDPSPLGALVPTQIPALAEGAVYEFSPAAIGVASEIARRVNRFGGAALMIDYGRSAPEIGDTLQAVSRHARVDALAEPGAADLSAHVDFAALRRTVVEAGAGAFGPITQRDFLIALGIEIRARALSRSAAPAEAAMIERAVERLIGQGAMGALFKALAIAPPGTSPAGFPAED